MSLPLHLGALMTQHATTMLMQMKMMDLVRSRHLRMLTAKAIVWLQSTALVSAEVLQRRMNVAFAVAMELLKGHATVMATFWMTVVYAVATTQVARTARALRMERLYSMTVAFAILHTSTTSSRTFQCTLKMRTH